MKNLMVFMAVLALALVGSTAMAAYDDPDNFTVSGAIGIGTEPPDAGLKLDIEGGSILVDAFNLPETGIFFRGGFVTTDKYTQSILSYNHTGSYADGISINGYDGVSFCTGANSRQERMRITQDGNVGIGTTTPTSKFQISNGDLTLQKSHLSAQETWLQSIRFTDEHNRLGAQIIGRRTAWSGAPIAISFETGGLGSTSEVMRITAGGNVGIGTTSPDSAAKLDVVGNIYADEVFVQVGAGTIADPYVMVNVKDLGITNVALQARIEALEAIVMDLPFGLRNQKDRNADGF